MSYYKKNKNRNLLKKVCINAFISLESNFTFSRNLEDINIINVHSDYLNSYRSCLFPYGYLYVYSKNYIAYKEAVNLYATKLIESSYWNVHIAVLEQNLTYFGLSYVVLSRTDDCWEFNVLTDQTKSWKIAPKLEDIKGIMWRGEFYFGVLKSIYEIAKSRYYDKILSTLINNAPKVHYPDLDLKNLEYDEPEPLRRISEVEQILHSLPPKCLNNLYVFIWEYNPRADCGLCVYTIENKRNYLKLINSENVNSLPNSPLRVIISCIFYFNEPSVNESNDNEFYSHAVDAISAYLRKHKIRRYAHAWMPEYKCLSFTEMLTLCTALETAAPPKPGAAPLIGLLTPPQE